MRDAIRAPLLTIALLGGVEFGIARSNLLWKRAPNTMAGAFYAIENEVISHASPPTIVFVGSSRMRDAVDPRRLEGVLGLPRGGVLNLALTGGTPYEAMLYYERNRPLLRQASILVIGVEDWYWNVGVPRDEVELMFATFSDRWRWFQERHQLGLLVGGVWRTFEVQDPLLRFGASFYKGVERVKFREDRVVWRSTANTLEIGPDETDIDGAIDHVMESYTRGPHYEDSLGRLLAMAHGDGVRLVLVQLPLRDRYVDRMRERHPDMQPYVEERMRTLAGPVGATVLLFNRASTLTIPENRFYDYGHLTEDGCRRMNTVWASNLASILASRSGDVPK